MPSASGRRRSYVPCWVGLLILLAAAAGRGADAPRPDRFTGPWDLPALRQAPKVTESRRDGTVTALYYEGEPYRGKPTRVFAYLARPEQKEGKLPAMVLVHGGGGAAFKEWAELWARRGYVALAMDLAGHGPGRKRLPDGGPDQDDKSRFEAGAVKDHWSYHAVANVARGVSLLAGLPEVDADCIGVTGMSWGGYLTCIVAGLDDRLKVAVPRLRVRLPAREQRLADHVPEDARRAPRAVGGAL
jgi:cephalosporin-C deacetylase-like acetyl esterase